MPFLNAPDNPARLPEFFCSKLGIGKAVHPGGLSGHMLLPCQNRTDVAIWLKDKVFNCLALLLQHAGQGGSSAEYGHNV